MDDQPKTVRFLMDYRGVLTRELFHPAGEVVELHPDEATRLVAAGRAELVVEDSPPSVPLNDPGPDMPEKEPALADRTTKELRDMAKAAGIRGYARMKKVTLLERLEEHDA